MRGLPAPMALNHFAASGRPGNANRVRAPAYHRVNSIHQARRRSLADWPGAECAVDKASALSGCEIHENFPALALPAPERKRPARMCKRAEEHGAKSCNPDPQPATPRPLFAIFRAGPLLLFASRRTPPENVPAQLGAAPPSRGMPGAIGAR